VAIEETRKRILDHLTMISDEAFDKELRLVGIENQPGMDHCLVTLEEFLAGSEQCKRCVLHGICYALFKDQGVRR
jgi:hypothetical protein